MHPIADYGIIGDLRTVALTSTAGSIDYMCYPRFDSPTVFAALLDDDGGSFTITPLEDDTTTKQLYLPETNILLTRFLSEEGVAEISDFMPIEDGCGSGVLVRRVKVVRGDMTLKVCCAPRFDYARASHTAETTEAGEVLFHSEPFTEGDALSLRLWSDASLTLDDAGDATATVHLNAGESVTFILEADHPDRPDRRADYAIAAFKQTANYWRSWMGQSEYAGRWRSMVNRSALTLKLLTSCEFGSIVAAPTFGLPEVIGGERNWDYRYTWVRDASFTLYALMRLGYTLEAGDFMRYLEERCFADQQERKHGHPLQVMYGIDGQRDLEEAVLEHMEGYEGSTPVRIGNAAHEQLQLDIYGELMDSVYLHDKYGTHIHWGLWQNLVEIINWVCDNWHQPDDGIWEVRGGQQYFLYSRLMLWVAVDRGVRLALKRSLPAPLARWREVRTTIHHSIYEDFWNEDIQAFTQTTDNTAMDASTLIMPLVKFISPDDPRWLSTLRRIEDELVEDSLVYRYRNDKAAPDGLEGVEGSFSMCSFWYVECLSRSGDVQQARLVFEKMLGYANHLGLYAEEIGPSGEHLGNFPQAFTHLALISTAFDLNRRLDEAGWKA
jgi:GH15 family glucan-1,4-alpha-glucosidase